jgi:DNA modification methylase
MNHIRHKSAKRKNEDVRFVQGDGMDTLQAQPKNSVQLILTDPPYCISRDSGMNTLAKKIKRGDGNLHRTVAQWETFLATKPSVEWDRLSCNSKSADPMAQFKNNYMQYGSIYGSKYAVTTDYGEWDASFDTEQLRAFVKEFYRVLGPSGTAIIWYDLWKASALADMMRDAGFKQIRMIFYEKTNPQPLNSALNYLTNCREVAVTGVKKSKPTFNSKYDRGVYRYPIPSGKFRIHPSQKPVRMFMDLIEKHSDPGDLIMDPFLGSGTTAVAVNHVNIRSDTPRSFLGCEKDPEFFKRMVVRFDEDVPV